MKMMRCCLCMLLLMMSSFVWAARVIPADMRIVQLKQASGKQVVLANTWGPKRILTLGVADNSQLFRLNNNVQIRDDRNRFITFNRLSQYQGRVVGVRFNRNKQIQEIWILSPNEQLMLKQRPQVNQ
ncbi:hypothetical protein PT286_09480 [Neisseriaceae bacterium ESL0693]|nr:hypothetical protein [Neisseriaceae bacterium ESL0693]